VRAAAWSDHRSEHAAALNSSFIRSFSGDCEHKQLASLYINPSGGDTINPPISWDGIIRSEMWWNLIAVLAALTLLLAIGWWWGDRLFACLLVLAVLGIRFDLFFTGNLYSSTDVWAADAITAVLVFLAMTIFLAHTTAPAGAGASWERRLAAAGVAVAVPVGLIGAVQLAAPSTPHAATAPACAGASVADGAFLATTPATGINARSGPDTSYPQVRRFAASCTLSFDGYCIGEPTDDLLITGDPDQRWLILHRPWETWPWDHMPWAKQAPVFVAAGKVQSQSAESALGTQPDPECAQHGGWSPPKPLALATAFTKGVVTAHATAIGAELIGISVESSRHPQDGSDAIFHLANPAPLRTDTTSSIIATWNAETITGKAIGPYAATFTLMASVCLAPAVPDPRDYAVSRFAWNGQTVTPLANNSPSVSNEKRLQTEACRVAPDYPKAEP
jgi:hypothetical protein